MQVNLNAKPPHFEQIRTENIESRQPNNLANSLLDQKQPLDPSFISQIGDRLLEKRVEARGWASFINNARSGIRLDEKHDIYENHPESKYSPLGTRPRKLRGPDFESWFRKFAAIVNEKPSLDAHNMAMANISNLMKNDYQALLHQSERALARYPKNLEARIENFIARYRLAKEFDKHALELYHFRLELMKTEVTKPAFSIMFEMLYSYFHDLDRATIHTCVALNRFNSVLEECLMKLIDYYNEKEDFVNFHTDLLASPDHLYLFWICQCLADNARILKENDQLPDFPNLKKFVENEYNSTDMSNTDLQMLAYELCCVETGDVNLEWQLSRNLSKALLYFELFEIEDEYSRLVHE